MAKTCVDCKEPIEDGDEAHVRWTIKGNLWRCYDCYCALNAKRYGHIKENAHDEG